MGELHQTLAMRRQLDLHVFGDMYVDACVRRLCGRLWQICGIEQKPASRASHCVGRCIIILITILIIILIMIILIMIHVLSLSLL